MNARKLNYRFHDPNPPGVAANYILKVLLEANRSKVENAIQEAVQQLPDNKKQAAS